MDRVIVENFTSYRETIRRVLAKAGLARKIQHQNAILLKLNLTAVLPPPTTTPVELVEEVIRFCQENSRAHIVIAEGSGGCDTQKAFEKLGYYELSRKYKVETLDLNRALRVEKEDPKAIKLKKVFLPKIAFESYIINLPVLKVHGEAIMTAAMKNVFGFYLNQKYLGKNGELLPRRTFREGWWNKSELHSLGVNEAIGDLNGYIKFNFNLIDASIGQLRGEVHGVPCSPPIQKIIAGYNPKEIDRICASFLGLDVEGIRYLE